MNKKNVTTDSDTGIYLTVEHKRGKKKPKYSFAVVAKTILISASLIASLTISGPIPVLASQANQQTATIQSLDSYTLNRLAGESRYDTSAQIALDGWQQSDYAILAYGGDFPDALAAAPLAAKLNAPILLTEKDALSPQTAQVLSKLQVKHVYIAGGEAVVSQKVASQVSAKGIKVERISGQSRYDTAVAIAEQLGTNVNTLFIVNGNGYPDALSVGSVAGKMKEPILLVDKDTIPNSVQNYLKSHNITKTYVIGGTGVVSDSVLNQLPNPSRLSGNSRYDTNIAVINQFASLFSTDSIAIATGGGFADALAGASYASKSSMPLLLLPDDGNQATQNYISSKIANLKKVVIFGGEGVIKKDHLDNYMRGTAMVQPVQQTVKSEEDLASQLISASNFVNTLYNNNILSVTALNQLTTRLVELENKLNEAGVNLNTFLTVVNTTDNVLSSIDVNKSNLQKTADSVEALNKSKQVLESIKSKIGADTSSSSISTPTSQNSTSSQVIYVAPITEYGQRLSKNPVSGYEKINVLYGYHTYGSNNQKEYDAVMRVINEEKVNVANDIANVQDPVWNAVHNYLNGSASEMETLIATKYWKDFLSLPTAALDRLLRVAITDGNVVNHSSDPGSIDGESAYQKIFYNKGDCNADAYASQAVYDSFGYNTRIQYASGNPGHAWCEVEIAGNWYSTEGGLGKTIYKTDGTLIPATNSGRY